jgi:hypothetical protein
LSSFSFICGISLSPGNNAIEMSLITCHQSLQDSKFHYQYITMYALG